MTYFVANYFPYEALPAFLGFCGSLLFVKVKCSKNAFLSQPVWANTRSHHGEVKSPLTRSLFS